MARRLAIVLGLLLALKLLARFTLIGAFTTGAIQFFAIVDVAALVLTAAWVAIGEPKPARDAALRRAATVAGALLAGLWLENVALQVPLVAARATDTLEAALLLLASAVPNGVLGGPVGAVLLWLLAATIAWGWLMLRLPTPAQVRRARTPGPPSPPPRRRPAGTRR